MIAVRRAIKQSDWRFALAIVIMAAVVLLALWITQAKAWDANSPTQHGVGWNGIVISGANAAVSYTITPQASEKARIPAISAWCTGGSASISITNGGSFSKGWVSSPGLVGTGSTGVAWTPVPFTGDLGKVLVVTLGPCGGTDVGTLTVQADTYAP